MSTVEKLEAAMRQRALEQYDEKVGQYSLIYDRRDLPDLGVRLSLTAQFDYSEDGCRLVIEKLRLRLEYLQSGHWSIGINPRVMMIEVEGAIAAEELNLQRERMAENMPRIYVGEAAE